MEIGSINQTISFLGTNRASARDSISPVTNRRVREHAADVGPSKPAKTFEAAFATQFSQAALDRAENLKGRGQSESQELSGEERGEVRKLKQRDREVRRHEQAHQGAAGNLASGAPSFETTRGPDGKQYAVSGEVQIDASPVSGNPEATILKMRQVQRAARAPANPSGTDLKVASLAARQEASARTEMRQEMSPESQEPSDGRFEAPSRLAAYRPSNDSSTGGLLNRLA